MRMSLKKIIVEKYIKKDVVPVGVVKEVMPISVALLVLSYEQYFRTHPVKEGEHKMLRYIMGALRENFCLPTPVENWLIDRLNENLQDEAVSLIIQHFAKVSDELFGDTLYGAKAEDPLSQMLSNVSVKAIDVSSLLKVLQKQEVQAVPGKIL